MSKSLSRRYPFASLPCLRSFSTTSRASSHIGSSPVPYTNVVSLKFEPSIGSNVPHSLTLSGPQGSSQVPLPNFVELKFRPSDATRATWSSGTPSWALPTPGSSKSKADPDALPFPSSTSQIDPHEGELIVSVGDTAIKHQRAMWGTSRSLIANAIKGVTEGFALPVRLVGVGYRAELQKDPLPRPGMSGQRLLMKLGYAQTNSVYVPIPKDLECALPQPTKIVIRGKDKTQVGQLAATIRALRKPEPYKGKGVFVGDETIRLKDVKKK